MQNLNIHFLTKDFLTKEEGVLQVHAGPPDPTSMHTLQVPELHALDNRGIMIINSPASIEVGQGWQQMQVCQPRRGDMAKLCLQSQWNLWDVLRQNPARPCWNWLGRRVTNGSRIVRQARVIVNCGWVWKEHCCGQWRNV